MGRGLSQLQCAILEVLAEVPASPKPTDQYGARYIGHLPTTGDILTALGRERDNANYAAVSKALARLGKRGLVEAFGSQISTQGKGHRYSLSLKVPRGDKP